MDHALSSYGRLEAELGVATRSDGFETPGRSG